MNKHWRLDCGKSERILHNSYTPHPTNFVCWGVYSFHVHVRLSVTFRFFLSILKRQWWKFIKLCRHIDIDKMYVYNRKLRARGQFCWELLPFVILNGAYVVHIQGIQLVPQLLLKHPDTLYTQCRHIELLSGTFFRWESWKHFYGHSSSSADSRITGERMCTKYW